MCFKLKLKNHIRIGFQKSQILYDLKSLCEIWFSYTASYKTPFPCFAFSLFFHILPSLPSLSLLCMLFAACRNNMLLLICHVYLTGGNKAFACLLACRSPHVRSCINTEGCQSKNILIFKPFRVNLNFSIAKDIHVLLNILPKWIWYHTLQTTRFMIIKFIY